MNNFLFRPEFLMNAVDWDHVMDSSGKFYMAPGTEGDGLGFVRVDFEVIEHVKSSPAILLERDAFTVLLDRMQARMMFPVRDREIDIPLGFNPDFDMNGEPTNALHRVRRRVAMKARLENMQMGTPEGLQDPLYLCLMAQKEAVRDFMVATNDRRSLFLEDVSLETWDVEINNLDELSQSTRRAIKRVQWGPICYLGYGCGLTFTFYPYNSTTKRFHSVA
jgi:hypothetical protein